MTAILLKPWSSAVPKGVGNSQGGAGARRAGERGGKARLSAAGMTPLGLALTAVALTAISLVSTPAVAKAMHEASPDWLYAVLLVLMAFAGAGSLGFMGLGLRSCAE